MAIELPALRLHQYEETLYQTRVSLGLLAQPNISSPDAYNKETNPGGYQRAPSSARFKRIADYIRDASGYPPMMPQSIVLNARGPVVFESDAGDKSVGTLVIPDSTLPLHEVEGQHRLGGFRRAVSEDPALADYEVPLTVINEVEIAKEAALFFVINTTQVKVATDLAHRLITQQAANPDLLRKLQGAGKAWIPAAVEIVDILNATPDQPWFHRIGIPGPDGARLLIRQTSFVPSLKPILTLADLEETPAEVAQNLVAYWCAADAVWPDAFADPKSHVLTKTVGVFPMHAVFPLVCKRAQRARGRLDQKGFERILRDMDLPEDFWHKDGQAGQFAGAKGFKIVEAILREAVLQNRSAA